MSLWDKQEQAKSRGYGHIHKLLELRWFRTSTNKKDGVGRAPLPRLHTDSTKGVSRRENIPTQCGPAGPTQLHLGVYRLMHPVHRVFNVQRLPSIDHYSHLTRAIMSNLPSSSSLRSDLDVIFDAARRTYKKQTGKDITARPLATELQSWDSPDAILALLRRQIPTPDQS